MLYFVLQFVNLSAHTMPAMSLICGEFVKSLLIPADSTSRHSSSAASDAALTNGVTVNGNGVGHQDSDGEHEDEELGEEARNTLDTRKTLLEQNEKLVDLPLEGETDLQGLDNRLRTITALRTKLRI